jgi:hypothetical protein
MSEQDEIGTRQPSGAGPRTSAIRPLSTMTVPRRPTTKVGLRLGVAATALVLAVLGSAVTAGAAGRQAALRHAVTRAEPLAVAAEDVYQGLSDADAAAAEIFLSAGRGGTAAQARFDADLHAVSAALTQVTADSGDSGKLRAATDELQADLPVFTRLVGAALADARQNLPVGAAYLREASALVRDRLLPAAQAGLAVESGRLGSDGDRASGGAGVDVALVAVALTVLAGIQVFIGRRTRRLLSPGLVAASVLVVVAGVWALASGLAERDAAATARGYWQAADSAIATDLAAVQAHGDELLGLAARGEDQGAYEHDFTVAAGRLAALLAADRGPEVDQVRPAQNAWASAHRALAQTELDPQPDNSANIKALALVTDPATGSGGAFARVDEALRHLTGARETDYLTAARSGHDDLAGLPAGAAVLTALALAAALLGLDRRLKEYR